VAERRRSGLAGWDIAPGRIAQSVQATDVTIFTPGSTAGVPLNVVGSLAAPKDGDAADTEGLRQKVSGYVSSLLRPADEDAGPVHSRARPAADLDRAVLDAPARPRPRAAHRTGARPAAAQARRVRPRHVLPGRGELLVGAAQLLSVVFGGRRSTRSVVTGLGRAVSGMASRRGTVSRTAQRREAAEEQAAQCGDDLEELEQRRADELTHIDARWQEVATNVEEVTVGLERDDIDVTGVALVWVRSDG
jgi:hypothetical protein